MTESVEQALAQYRWAAEYLLGLIQGPPSPPPGATVEEIRARAKARLERLAAFLDFIGRPQDAYPSVHVTGTSGKGSTSTFIASILTQAGYRTGLHLSPYLQVETEKLQIDGRLLPADRFARYVAELDGLVESWAARGGQRLTYGEFWVALTFLAFARERVDVAVVEVGAGGRFDLTNVLQSEVAVITSVGLDHVRTLGPTLLDIAWHKAGIIKAGRPAVTTVTEPGPLAVIRQETELQAAPLDVLYPGQDYAELECDEQGSRMLDLRRGRVYRIGLPGRFQVANAAVAIAAVEKLGHLPRGEVSAETIAAGLEQARIPGRVEVVQVTPQVVLDGAHNPDKVGALLESLRCLGHPRRRIVVYGVLEGHDAMAMAQQLSAAADQVVVTAPAAVQREHAPLELLVETFQAQGCPAVAIPVPLEAVAWALEQAEPDDQVLVTGSLYLVGQARERWYPASEIVLQCSCWPLITTRQGERAS